MRRLRKVLRRLPDLNREVWLVVSLIGISVALNVLVAGTRLVLGFYVLPTIASAYLYGRRHATLTAFASVLIVVLAARLDPDLLVDGAQTAVGVSRWMEITVWGGILMLTGYFMGSLYDRHQQKLRELRRTYNGVVVLLQQFVSKDEYTQHHSYRVSIYATKIAAQLGLSEHAIEDIRVASLLHDIGKLKTSRELLYKASKLTGSEYDEVKKHVEQGVALLQPVGGSLQRVIPIILAHHDRFDGRGYHPTRGKTIPLEARIVAVADVFDALTSDRPYRKAMSPFEAKETIVEESGEGFDPKVVEAFLQIFRRGGMEVPKVMV